MIECPVCEGRGGWHPKTGEVRRRPTFANPGEWHRCPYCDGTGHVKPLPDLSGYR